MKKILSYDGWSLIVIGLIGGLLSFLLYDFIWRFLTIFIGIILLLCGIAYLIFTINAKNYKQDNIIKPAFKSGLLILVGVCLIIPWTSWIVQFCVGLVVGIYLLLICIIRLVESENKKEQIKKDIVKYVIALLVIVLGIQDSGKYVAIIFFIFVFVCGIIALIMDNKEQVEKKQIRYEEINDIEYYVDDNKD